MLEEFTSILDNGLVIKAVVFFFLMRLQSIIIDFVTSQTTSVPPEEEDDVDQSNDNASSMELSSLIAMCGMLCRGDNVVNDELFQDPPPKEDCPICFLPMPFASGAILDIDWAYGKIMCNGCMEAAGKEMAKGNMEICCPFCRTPVEKTQEESDRRLKKRMKAGDPNAFFKRGAENYELGEKIEKVVGLWQQAAERGSLTAHYQVGLAYSFGKGIEKDMEKSLHHSRLAAMGGHEIARYNLGITEGNNGNFDLSMKHFMIGANSGVDRSLKKVGEGYRAGLVTKDEYANTLRAYQSSREEMKSEQRTKASASDFSKAMSRCNDQTTAKFLR